MDSIKAESSGGPAAPEMRAMTLARRNLPAIRDAEMRAASYVPHVDLDAVHRPIAAAAEAHPRTGERDSLLIAEISDLEW